MDKLSPDIIDVRASMSAMLSGKRKRMPQHVNRISSLDDPCLRKLYYQRHDYDKATDTDDSLLGVFETGNVLEPVIERIVSEAGSMADPRWRIVGAQTPTNDALLKEHQISGTIDGFLQVFSDGQWVTLGVVDIKTMSQNVFGQINTYADLSRYAWTKRYRGQVMLYALAHNLEWCYLLLVNKQNLFDQKLIPFPVDMEYCDGLLAKAKTVNAAIKDDTPPAGINDPDICPKCPFYSFCAPDLTTGADILISDNADLEAVLERLAELEPTAKEYNDLEDERDRLLVKGQNVACGRFLVTWKKTQTTYKPQEGRVVDVWRKKIVATK